MSKCKYNNLHTRTIIYKPSTYVVYVNVNSKTVSMYDIKWNQLEMYGKVQESTSGSYSHSQQYEKNYDSSILDMNVIRTKATKTKFHNDFNSYMKIIA